MAVTVKDYAAQLGLSAERLVVMLAEADLVDKDENSELTDREKRTLVMQLQKGRVRQISKHPEQSVVQPQRRTGSTREIVVEIKGNHTLAPRPILNPPTAGEQEIPADDASPESEQPEVQSETTLTIHDDEGSTDSPALSDGVDQMTDPDDSTLVQEPPDETPEVVATEPTEQLQPPSEPQKADDSTAPKRSRSKRKTQPKQRREQLHVVKGREKLQRDRERRKRAQKLDDRITQHTFQTPSRKIIHNVSISNTNSIRYLAQAMSIKAVDVIKYLIDEVGLQVTINESIDRDTATLLVEDLGHKPIDAVALDIETQLMGAENETLEYVTRPAVVAVMGHVDHGKTTLLDTIRATKVVDTEKGGITQHIGAYMVATPRGKITFLDTPGHEAFTAMRARGARATDIVILVVAADDGVMPQTVEAINHAKFAAVPMIVAINKIDKADTDPSRVLRELTEHDVIAESLGGDVQVVEISALKNRGIDDLLERIQLQAELMDETLKAPVNGVTRGIVIEARVDRGRGTVVTVLVQKGQLSPKLNIVAGLQKGKIRQLTDYRGKVIKVAGPSTPVEIAGFASVPEVGDEFVCPPDERSAQQLIEYRKNGRQSGSGIPEFNFEESEDPKIINVVIKADVSGSAEALADAVKRLSDDRVGINVIHAMVGGVSQSDVNLAIAANAVILAFNVRAEATARQLISMHNLTVIYSGIIYEAIDELEKFIHDKIGPNVIEEVVATIDVLEIFKYPKIGTIAGCLVKEGTVRNKSPVRVVRDNIIIHNGMIESLRRFQNDVNEVKAGLECGIQLKNYNDIKIADQLEVYASRVVS